MEEDVDIRACVIDPDKLKIDGVSLCLSAHKRIEVQRRVREMVAAEDAAEEVTGA